jgi:hypothetical protein
MHERVDAGRTLKGWAWRSPPGRFSAATDLRAQRLSRFRRFGPSFRAQRAVPLDHLRPHRRAPFRGPVPAPATAVAVPSPFVECACFVRGPRVRRGDPSAMLQALEACARRIRAGRRAAPHRVDRPHPPAAVPVEMNGMKLVCVYGHDPKRLVLYCRYPGPGGSSGRGSASWMAQTLRLLPARGLR